MKTLLNQKHVAFIQNCVEVLLYVQAMTIVRFHGESEGYIYKCVRPHETSNGNIQVEEC